MFSLKFKWDDKKNKWISSIHEFTSSTLSSHKRWIKNAIFLLVQFLWFIHATFNLFYGYILCAESIYAKHIQFTHHPWYVSHMNSPQCRLDTFILFSVFQPFIFISFHSRRTKSKAQIDRSSAHLNTFQSPRSPSLLSFAIWLRHEDEEWWRKIVSESPENLIFVSVIKFTHFLVHSTHSVVYTLQKSKQKSSFLLSFRLKQSWIELSVLNFLFSSFICLLTTFSQSIRVLQSIRNSRINWKYSKMYSMRSKNEAKYSNAGREHIIKKKLSIQNELSLLEVQRQQMEILKSSCCSVTIRCLAKVEILR